MSVIPNDRYPQLQRTFVAAEKHNQYSQFERHLSLVSKLAIVAAALYQLTRFLGFCALTWSTVVLLGGFVSAIRKRDFYLVSSLLLLEAWRVVAWVFFSNLVTRRLVTIKANAFKVLIWLHGQKISPKFIYVRITAPIIQILIISPSIAFPLLAVRSVRYPQGSSPFDSVEASLYIFYYLVLINAIVSIISILYSLVVGLALIWYFKDEDSDDKGSDDESLQRYYDEIVWRAVDSGLLQAKDIDLFSFAFKVQAQEYSNGAHKEDVQRHYSRLIKHLLHSLDGFHAACIFLDSRDIYEQLAAANMVGFWAESKEHEYPRRRLFLQTQLLSKLADKIGCGTTGWAATITFGCIADVCPDVLFRIANTGGKKVADILLDEIQADNNSSLCCIQAIVPLLKNSRARISNCKIERLGEELNIFLKETTQVSDKIRIAYCLYILNDNELPNEAQMEILEMKIHDMVLLEENLQYKEMMKRQFPFDKGSESTDNSHLNHLIPCLLVAIPFLLVLGTILLFMLVVEPHWR